MGQPADSHQENMGIDMPLRQRYSNDDMKRVQFSATFPDKLMHPLHDRITESGSVTRAELLMWSPTVDATTLFWCDGPTEATETVIEAIDSLVVSSFVEGGAGTYVFLRQQRYEFASALLETISDAHAVFLPPVVFLDSGEIQFEAVGATTSLSSFHSKLSDLVDVTIEYVDEFDRMSAPWGLTDRQQAAIEAAVSVGYYEVPREGTITDVAGVLDCSPSTAGELVRKAEAEVIQKHVETA